MRHRLNVEAEPFEAYSEFDEELEESDTELADLEREEEVRRGLRAPRPTTPRLRPWRPFRPPARPPRIPFPVRPVRPPVRPPIRPQPPGPPTAPTEPPVSTEPEPKPAAPPTTYFKDSPRLQSVPLPPSRPITVVPTWPSIRRMLASTYNRLGGLMQAVANEARIEVQAALGVWQVESGGRTHTVGRAIIRFENHLLYRLWGKNNQAIYNRHFQHGGHMGVPGSPWQNHKFRENTTEPLRSFHGNQDLEYRVLALATRLAGEEPALKSISIGGPQILTSNYSLIGYSSPREMSDAFQASERAHVLGFFDFCRHRAAPSKGDLLKYLRNYDWSSFARYYNGPGQVEKYGGLIQNAYEHARQLPI